MPFDTSYRDTILFSNSTDQAAYFSGKAKYTISNMSPIRLQNKIRIGIEADNLYDCNYMAFKNANFKNRWFYAFITKIEFINIHESYIEFEIDVMQTWAFDYTLKPSYVIREHVNDDAIGKNIVPEPFNITNYVSNEDDCSHTIENDFMAVIYHLKDSNGNLVGRIEGYNYSGLRGYAVQIDRNDLTTTIQNINNAIEQCCQYAGLVTDGYDADNIITICLMPRQYISGNSIDSDIHLSGSAATGVSGQWIIERNTTIDGYQPKNNKLFTAPFNFLMMYTPNTSNNFAYEFFAGGNAWFKLCGCISPTPEITCIPQSYKYIHNNINERLSISDFPKCSWGGDEFKAWLAQNTSNVALKIGASTMAAVAMPSPLTIGNLVYQVGASAIDVDNASKQSASARTGEGATALFTQGLIDFWYAKMSITADEARKIDSYFSMYGYAVHEVKIPNRTGRQSWNYVKTEKCSATGSIPFDDLARIREIYNNGVTFWHGDYVGDYSRSNNIV